MAFEVINVHHIWSVKCVQQPFIPVDHTNGHTGLTESWCKCCLVNKNVYFQWLKSKEHAFGTTLHRKTDSCLMNLLNLPSKAAAVSVGLGANGPHSATECVGTDEDVRRVTAPHHPSFFCFVFSYGTPGCTPGGPEVFRLSHKCCQCGASAPAWSCRSASTCVYSNSKD